MAVELKADEKQLLKSAIEAYRGNLSRNANTSKLPSVKDAIKAEITKLEQLEGKLA